MIIGKKTARISVVSKWMLFGLGYSYCVCLFLVFNKKKRKKISANGLRMYVGGFVRTLQAYKRLKVHFCTFISSINFVFSPFLFQFVLLLIIISLFYPSQSIVYIFNIEDNSTALKLASSVAYTHHHCHLPLVIILRPRNSHQLNSTQLNIPPLTSGHSIRISFEMDKHVYYSCIKVSYTELIESSEWMAQ